jgi:hypothetical protein
MKVTGEEESDGKGMERKANLRWILILALLPLWLVAFPPSKVIKGHAQTLVREALDRLGVPLHGNVQTETESETMRKKGEKHG